MEAELEETIEHEVQHHLEDRAGISTLQNEDALFEAHARFRAGLDVPAGWYRQGEPIEPGLWAVDLDLFLELPIRSRTGPRCPARASRSRSWTTPFEVDVPADADPDEIWTFEGEGLVEGDEEEEEPVGNDESEDDPGGSAGALHILPIVR